ncbi:DUF5908 family protein [Chitinophaga sedimenti]|uniref:DUF5908 family protein n=1 Tax=Chitinophaga sedimenti TaxID=2033606 RepID=UPI0020069A0E|nr:DUF5908 family protein [Chitinophaga sedimenti]MCK7559668.1 DUF5908 family protein [Chitinophaga sedimenti]
MPVIIREIQITAEVGPGSSNAGTAAPTAAPVNGADREAIIAACVEEVLRIMREKQER